MNCLFIPTHCAAHSAFLVYSDTNVLAKRRFFQPRM
jgi:hypothetical protein